MFTISKEERNLGAVSAEELESTLAYELPREVVMEDRLERSGLLPDKDTNRDRSLEDVVKNIRNDLGLKSFDDALALELQIFLPARFFVAVAWPEWPIAAYLSINAQERGRRLRAQAKPGAKLTDQDMGGFLTRTRPGDIPVQLSIPPWLPEQTILRMFTAVLRHRGIGQNSHAKGGRPMTAQNLRDALFALCVHRLRSAQISPYDIIQQLTDAQGNYHYSSEKALRKPLAKAKTHIKSARKSFLHVLNAFCKTTLPWVLINRDLKKLGPNPSSEAMSKLLGSIPVFGIDGYADAEE